MSTLLQLQGVGVQDAYLTKDPQINVFQYSYYRYVNFAMDIVKLPLNEVATFNKKTSCDIPKRGHLLSKIFLHLKLPKLIKNGGTYVSWSDTLGYAIFNDPIELEIGGIIVEKLYPVYLDIAEELRNSRANELILKSDVYSASKYNSENEIDLMIPLDFWFTKDYSLALPLLSMNYQEIKIYFKFREFLNCVNYDGNEPTSVPIIDSNIFVEYVYLDDIFLDTFGKQKHQYLIEQVQYNGDEKIPPNNKFYNSTLKFNHPCKEVVFCCVDMESYRTNNYFVYGKYKDPDQLTSQNLIEEAGLQLDGRRRFEMLPEFYWRLAFPKSVHSFVPQKYIYTMPFSIKPEDIQPTGSLNMSRFNDVTLTLTMINNNPECKLYIFAVTYNIVTIENGILYFEFSV